LSETDIQLDSLIAVSAGTETSASILTFIVYFVCSQASIYARLQAELDDAILDASQDLSDDILKPLPYLNAVIEETLRCGTPFPLFFRVTPPEGVLLSDEMVPGGVNVAVPIWAQHRHPENFRPFPEEFRPERWLSEGLGPDTYTDTSALMAWSYGMIRRVISPIQDSTCLQDRSVVWQKALQSESYALLSRVFFARSTFHMLLVSKRIDSCVASRTCVPRFSSIH
jgi:hypothetical protein